MSSVPILSLAQFAASFLRLPLLDEVANIVAPVIAIDLSQSASSSTVDFAISRASACNRILVGLFPNRKLALNEDIQRIAEAMDVNLREPQHVFSVESFVPVENAKTSLERLNSRAAANPQAALILKRLLRDFESTSVRGAIEAESLAYSTLMGGAEFARWLGAQAPRRRPPAPPDPVKLCRAGGELSIVFDWPERRNAFGRMMRDALVRALQVPLLDPGIEHVEISGTGPVFCSGGDLAEFGTAPDAATAHFVRTHGGAALLLDELRDKVSAKVHGACVGAGVELSAFAARVQADPAATFRLPEVAMGLTPGAGGSVSISRRIGRWRTLYMALSGELIDAPTALSWGLVDAVSPVAPAGP